MGERSEGLAARAEAGLSIGAEARARLQGEVEGERSKGEAAKPAGLSAGLSAKPDAIASGKAEALLGKLEISGRDGTRAAGGRAGSAQEIAIEGRAEAQISAPENPDALERAKENLVSTYGVVFDSREDLPKEEQSRFREPTLQELEVIRNALSRSPEARRKTVRLAFLTNDPKDGALATHQELDSSTARIRVHRTDSVAVDHDLKEGGVSLGSVLGHELGHHADNVAPRDDARLGWRKIGKDENGGDRFALQTKDGSYYTYVPEDRDTGRTAHWQKVNLDGSAVTDQSDSQISDQQMQTRARISQPMHPANNPCETFANSVRMYRQNEQTRAELKEKAPEIYEYIEEYDNRQIRRMGTDFFGIPEYQRNADGTISRNERAWNPVLMVMGQ